MWLVVLISLSGMGYYLLQRQSDEAATPDAARLLQQLMAGTPPERRDALRQLVAARAEAELTQGLAAADPSVVQLATAGLWECWTNEEGVEARRDIDQGTEAMNHGDLATAAAIFARLMAAHPGWGEAVNKQATVLYMQGKFEESIVLCRRVVALKPDHFGAWNGLALCAIQVENWKLALLAVRESLRLQPHSPMNRQLLRLVQSRLPPEV